MTNRKRRYALDEGTPVNFWRTPFGWIVAVEAVLAVAFILWKVTT